MIFKLLNIAHCDCDLKDFVYVKRDKYIVLADIKKIIKLLMILLIQFILVFLFTTSFEADGSDHPFIDSPGQHSHQIDTGINEKRICI